MEQKYINKILNFSNDIIGRGEELIINREQAKGIIKELEQDYVPIKIIKNRIKDLKLSGGSNGKDEIENQAREFAIEILEELLGE